MARRNEATQTGTSLAWTGVLTMKRKAADANAQDGTIGFIGTTAARELLEGRVRETGGGTYIWENNSIASCPFYASTLMPSATLLSGPFSMCHLGLWGGITIDASPYDTTLFKTGVVQWRVIVACDVALGCDPTAFTKASRSRSCGDEYATSESEISRRLPRCRQRRTSRRDHRIGRIDGAGRL